jgi:hypothetical protein
MRLWASLATVVLFALTAGACTDMPTLPSSTINSLTISGTAPLIGATSQYSATVLLATSPDVQNVTTLATWQSANAAVATVSKAGVVTGIAAGTTSITVTYNGTSVSADVTIHS